MLFFKQNHFPTSNYLYFSFYRQLKESATSEALYAFNKLIT